jgi:NitT/TauT family transport system ATP-binding protein
MVSQERAQHHPVPWPASPASHPAAGMPERASVTRIGLSASVMALMAHVTLEQAVKLGAVSSTSIAVKNLMKTFSAPGVESRFTVLDSISLVVDQGEFVSIVGPSGCGKSTLLNIIAGIESYEGGAVTVVPRAGKANSEPRIGYVFQSPRLLNWLTVQDNIQFVLEAQNIPRPKWRELVTKHLDMVGLGGQERNYPLNLSGGMQQRVAIARALAIEPDILLMDEPFSHLDAITARKMRLDLMDILAKAKPTILFVTHDLSEAVFLSDRIYMMSTKPARIFKEVAVATSRPRKPEDSKILDLEKSLVREFFGVLEAKA